MAATKEQRTTRAQKKAEKQAERDARESESKKPKPSATDKPVELPPAECISDLETYRPSEIARRMKLGRGWFKKARRNGLKVFKVAGKLLIRGESLNQYLAQQEREQSQ